MRPSPNSRAEAPSDSPSLPASASGGSGAACRASLPWFRRATIVALSMFLAGCGDLELEGPREEWPEPICGEGEVLDPEQGICRLPYCRWDEDCQEGLRCDWIEGRCVLFIP